jgi:long-chain acyl-CoA synthetase
VALRGWLADRLAAYKIPRAVVLVAELPRDERGKISRRALEALVAAGTEGRGASPAAGGVV